MPTLTGLYRYPIKGLSAQPAERFALAAGRPVPFDRVFALARPGAGIDPEAPAWAKKGRFVVLMLDEGLARVRTHLDLATMRLTARDGEATVLSADLGAAAGRQETGAFFHGLAPELPAPPVLVRSREGHFMDKPDNIISLINLATVRDLEARMGVAIDPLRFRANLYIDGAEPWSEFGWIGHDIRIGGAVLAADKRNGRCAATNVDPATGARDRDIPGALRSAFGHKDLGIYLVARNDSEIAIGDPVQVPHGAADGNDANGHAADAPTRRTPEATGRTFICAGCYFVYDEASGLPSDGIAPDTPFAAIPSDWRCPDCGAGHSGFRPTPG